MSVEIEPSELGFRRPFTSEVSEILRIRNPNHTPVAFKVKTTAPKQYVSKRPPIEVQLFTDIDIAFVPTQAESSQERRLKLLVCAICP
jgi:hypothetical protein